MHGSRYLEQFVQETLESEPAIVAALADGVDSIVYGTTAPFAVPALIHYPENLVYAGPLDSDGKPREETGRYVVRLICEGRTNAPILDAADVMLVALTGAQGQIVGIDGTYGIRLDVTGEWPNTSYIEVVNGTAIPHRELGDIFEVFITRN